MSKSKQDDNTALWLAIGLLAIIAFSIVSWVFMPFLPWTEQRQAGEEVMRDQIDADKALQDYRWFRSQYSEIQAERAQLQNAYEEEHRFHNQTWPDGEWKDHRDARETHERLHQRINARKDELESLVAEYNARSDDATRSMFKCHLPYQVDERFAITGPPGSDAPDQPNDTYIMGASPNQTPPEPQNCDGLPDDINTGDQSASLSDPVAPLLSSLFN